MAPRSKPLERAYEYAEHLVLIEKISFREAVARLWLEKRKKIDKTTLGRRITRRTEPPSNPGRPTALSNKQEVEFAENCRYYSVRGIPLMGHEFAELEQIA